MKIDPAPVRHAASVSLRLDAVCGSDFSELSVQASQVAVALADRLTLVHAMDRELHNNVSEESWERLVHSIRARLHEEQKMLGALSLASVETSVCVGKPAAVLLGEAKTRCANLIVVGAARQRLDRLWASKTIGETVAEAAEVPTLVVHQASPFLQWLRGDRRLRVFVGADFSGPSESALLWVDRLRNAGPCEIFAAFLETEPSVVPGDETVPSLFMDEMVLKAAHTPERLFESRVRRRFGLSHVHTRFGKSSGHSAGKLIQMAVQDEADVIVIGTHSRQGWQRIGHRSISRFVLRHAAVNVLVCPGNAGTGSENE